jgi:hypothetical protein
LLVVAEKVFTHAKVQSFGRPLSHFQIESARPWNGVSTSVGCGA